jgi:hypothetical protein
MKDSELKRLRDADLYKAYLQGLETGAFRNMSQAADYVIRQPAPQFYISAREANLHIGKILSRVSLISLNSTSRRRVWQIYDRYMEYLDAHPGCNLSRERIIEHIVDEPAPEFYLSWTSARHILKREVNKRRRKWTDT